MGIDLPRARWRHQEKQAPGRKLYCSNTLIAAGKFLYAGLIIIHQYG
jgi:hypothetical protein